jgi:hypothetical protein
VNPVSVMVTAVLLVVPAVALVMPMGLVMPGAVGPGMLAAALVAWTSATGA